MQPSTADFQFDRAGRHLTVYLSGDLDASNAKAMASAVLDHTNPDDERVWIDMSTTRFCDSTGFAQLVRLHHHVDRSGTGITHDPKIPDPASQQVPGIAHVGRTYAWGTRRSVGHIGQCAGHRARQLVNDFGRPVLTISSWPP